ncbi:MAG TPA: DUF1501 domain-containing protein, partial [Chthoniobacteraceae bacterium]|nr:DUF1501 domain-containing protein [Chthoniobacteraceae bacterium]
MKNMLLQTRREFLRTGLKGIGLLTASAYVPAFLARTAAAAGTATDARTLVVIQLSGGNDGLNTVVPFADDLYYKARPVIGIKASQVLKINDHLGLHPALAPMKGEFDAGKMAIIENVGYPNPNRSHFQSMEIWHTAEDSGPDAKHEVTGWLGRYFDAQCSGTDPHVKTDQGSIGMSFGKVMPQAFRNTANVGIALDNPDTFQWNASGETMGLAKEQEQIFAKLNNPNANSADMMNLTNLGGISGDEPETLDFLKHTAMNAIVAGDRLRGILSKTRDHAAYPKTGLSNQLEMIGRLIAGNFPTRVYYAVQGGFDTHANQPNTQARLLGDLAESVHAFLQDLRAQKNSDRVTVLAFSEFGRRVAENASAGT